MMMKTMRTMMMRIWTTMRIWKMKMMRTLMRSSLPSLKPSQFNRKLYPSQLPSRSNLSLLSPYRQHLLLLPRKSSQLLLPRPNKRR